MTINIFIMGWSNVGKTQIIKRIMSTYTQQNQYISTKEVEIYNYKNVIFYDIPYEKMNEIELLESDGIIILIDFNQIKSLEVVDEIRNKYKDKMIYLIGNRMISLMMEQYIKDFKLYGYSNGYQKDSIDIFIKNIFENKQDVVERLNDNNLDIKEMDEFIKEIEQDVEEFEMIRNNYFELREHSTFRLFNEKKREYKLNKMDKILKIHYYQNFKKEIENYPNIQKSFKEFNKNENGFHFKNLLKKL